MIHLPYICVRYLYTTKCTLVYIDMYPMKVIPLKRASHFHQNKYSLDVNEVVVPPCLFYKSSDRN